MLYNALNLEVSKIVPKTGNRPEIAGVFFRKDRTVATDSFRLVEVTCPGFEVENFPLVSGHKALDKIKPFILPRESAKTLLKTLNRKDLRNPTLPILQCSAITKQEKTMMEIMATNLEQSFPLIFRPIEGEYPDYEDIIPAKNKATVKISVNPTYLKELLEIAEKVNGENRVKEVELRIYKKNEMLRLDAKNQSQKFLGLLMTIKDN